MVNLNKPCVKCNKIDRYPSNGNCRHCAKKRMKKWYYDNLEYCAQTAKIWHDENQEKVKLIKRRYVDTNPKRALENSRRYRLKHPETRKMTARKTSHKWAPGEHEKSELIRANVDKCDCCGSLEPRVKGGWRADHNHDTGIFRGFTCNPCNIIIGYVEKYGLDMSPSISKYLHRFSRPRRTVLVLDDDKTRHEIFTDHFKDDIVTHVWTVDEANKALSNFKYDICMLDHDLNGHGVRSTMASMYGDVELTGYDVALFIARELDEAKRPDRVIVHSWNPPGARMMVACLREAGILAVYEPFTGSNKKPTELIADENDPKWVTVMEEALKGDK